MNWLERLKSSKACETNATKTTKTDFVVSVAPSSGPLNKIAGAQEAANSPTLAPSPLTAVVDIGTIRPPGLSPLLLAASLALDASIAATGLSQGNDNDHDRHQP